MGNKSRPVRISLVVSIVAYVVLHAISATAVTIQYNLIDSPGEGFRDPVWGPIRLEPL